MARRGRVTRRRGMRFEGKKALVTGASGGIGKAIVVRLKREGATVLTTDRTGAEINGDLTDTKFCDGLPSQAAEKMGGLDILVNNAGIITRGRITEATDDDLRLTMAVNVEAPFRLCRAAIPIMADAGGGAIV